MADYDWIEIAKWGILALYALSGLLWSKWYRDAKQGQLDEKDARIETLQG